MVKIVFTDLDGTLLNREHRINRKDYKTLVELGNRKIVRVAATGRSLYMVRKVIPEIFPFDYIIFSSGAGVINWHTKEIIYKNNLSSQEVKKIAQFLTGQNISFMLLDPIPENHFFKYYITGNPCQDFYKRLEIYKGMCNPFEPETENYQEASQFLVILPNEVNGFNQLKQHFEEIKIIRATSPLDHQSIWMEFFAKNVSKGDTAHWLCDRLGIDHELTLAIGNDYNDLDLLNYSKNSFVVSNAPEELKAIFQVTNSNQQCGFSRVVRKVID
jgi:Cof subfamily protein (haloacid dehalogenase superfamily)